MKAIILAAGMGTRLGKYTENLPKCMLEFRGKTLIDRQIEILKQCDIFDITIVKGYKEEKINIPGIKYCINKDFANTNMVETLFCAEAEMDDELLVLYSDILYEKGVLLKVINSKADIGVTVDADYLPYWQARMDNWQTDIESLVVENGKIVDLGDTSCSLDKARMRYVGILKFSKIGLQELKKVYHENKNSFYDSSAVWKRSKCFKKAYMTCLLQAIIDNGVEVNPILINRGWIEFDNVEDYERVNQWCEESTIKRFINLKK